MTQALQLQDYTAIAKRRFPYFVLPAVLLFVLGSAIVFNIPPVYRATAVILVESQQIPSDLVKSTVTMRADEQISRIEKRVMTRANLLSIIDEYGLYADTEDNLSESELLERMRSDISLELVSSETLVRRQANTVAFELSFYSENPELAAKVANELATLFLDENVKSRMARASETTAFLMQEADKLRSEVEAIDKNIAEYKQRHGNALPEHLDLRIGMVDRASAELKELVRDIKSLEEEKRFLEVEFTSGTSRIVAESAGSGEVLSPAAQLAALEAELVRKSSTYSQAHPDIRMLKRHIATLKREVGLWEKNGPNSAKPLVRDPAQALIQAKIAAADSRIVSLRTQKTALAAKIDALQEQIIETPQIERALKGLSRDYENATRKYEDVKAKHLEAQLAESLEEGQKAERFILLEPPLVPEEPAEPDLKKLFLMVAALSLGVGGGSAFAAEALDTRIRSVPLVTHMAGKHPLAVIPYITTAADRRAVSRRRMLLSVIVVFVVLAAVALALLVFKPFPPPFIT